MFDIEALDIDELEELRDACNRRLLQMRRTQGLSLPDLLRLFDDVKSALRDQGKEWHSLERWQWMEGEIRFWLNPTDQDIYRTGWFSIDDLIAWTQNLGPIVIEDEPDEAPWAEARGVPITWLPKGRADDPIVDQGNARLKLN
jgi:hypothetical protein